MNYQHAKSYDTKRIKKEHLIRTDAFKNEIKTATAE